MLTVVNDILDFSKIEAGRLSLDPVDFELRGFFKAVAATHANSTTSKGLGFSLALVEPLPPALHGDTLRIRQIVDNLIGNAVKFTLEGEIRLSIECPSTNPKLATLQISVSDTGISLAENMREHIFEKFTQSDASTTRTFGGTGLGLAICRQLAHLMSGRIQVESTLGAGSRFTLTIDLPITTIRAAARSNSPKTANKPSSWRKNSNPISS